MFDWRFPVGEYAQVVDFVVLEQECAGHLSDLVRKRRGNAYLLTN